MPLRLIHLTLALVLFAPALARAQTVSDSGTFVVRHGRDTVAIELFTRSETKLEGTLSIMDTKKTNQRYTAVIAPDATLPLVEVTVREGTDSAGRRRGCLSGLG